MLSFGFASTGTTLVLDIVHRQGPYTATLIRIEASEASIPRLSFHCDLLLLVVLNLDPEAVRNQEKVAVDPAVKEAVWISECPGA